VPQTKTVKGNRLNLGDRKMEIRPERIPRQKRELEDSLNHKPNSNGQNVKAEQNKIQTCRPKELSHPASGGNSEISIVLSRNLRRHEGKIQTLDNAGAKGLRLIRFSNDRKSTSKG